MSIYKVPNTACLMCDVKACSDDEAGFGVCSRVSLFHQQPCNWDTVAAVEIPSESSPGNCLLTLPVCNWVLSLILTGSSCEGCAIQLNLFAEPRIEPLSANHLHRTFAVLSRTKVHLSADELKKKRKILELKRLVSLAGVPVGSHESHEAHLGAGSGYASRRRS